MSPAPSPTIVAPRMRSVPRLTWIFTKPSVSPSSIARSFSSNCETLQATYNGASLCRGVQFDFFFPRKAWRAPFARNPQLAYLACSRVTQTTAVKRAFTCEFPSTTTSSQGTSACDSRRATPPNTRTATAFSSSPVQQTSLHPK